MSHAVVLVAVSPKAIEQLGGLEEAVAEQMHPFDEGREDREDGGWFADGSRWDWYQIGGRWQGELLGTDVLQKKALDIETIYRKRKQELTKNWHDAQKEKSHKELIYGVRDDETLKEYLSRQLPNKESCLSFYAFLSNRHWHEAERMGWFGGTTATECERKNPDYPFDNNKCLVKDETLGARIVNWQEPSEIWKERYYKRFIEPLPDDTYLVVVDYHV